jgi:hypothetical protein
LSLITRAFGSPKTPCTVGSGRKPGSNTRPTAAAFVAWFLPWKIMAISNQARYAKNLGNAQVSGIIHAKITHSVPRRPPEKPSQGQRAAPSPGLTRRYQAVGTTAVSRTRRLLGPMQIPSAPHEPRSG